MASAVADTAGADDDAARGIDADSDRQPENTANCNDEDSSDSITETDESPANISAASSEVVSDGPVESDEADFDDILSHVGQFGKYQKTIYWLLCLPAAYAAIVTLSFTFTGAIPKHRCRVDQCDPFDEEAGYKQFFLHWTIPRKSFGFAADELELGIADYEECRRYRRAADESLNSTRLTPEFCPDVYFSNDTQTCLQGWVFDDAVYRTTIVTEYDLVCERARWQSFVSGAYMAGMLVGSYLLGYVSDRIGRKPAFFLSLAITGISGVAATLAPTVLVFLIIRFITGAGNVAVFQTAFVLAMEYVGPDYRMACGIWIEFFFAGGEILVGVLAYYIRDWKPLQLIYHGIGILFVSYYWLVPDESARWQMARGRNAAARETLTKIGKVNGKPVPKSMLPSDHRHAKLSPKDKDSSDETMLDLLKVPRLRLQFFNVGYAWFVNVLVYYGLGMTSTSLGGDVHLTYILTMLIEFPAYCLCLLILNRFGRRLPFAILLMIGGIACLLTGLFQKGWFVMKMCLSLLGKLCISATFAIAFIYTGELYPTVVRNAGIGAASTCARMGGILAPFIADLGNIHSSLPYLIFGCAALLAGVLSLDLPETLGVKLPETVEEAAEFAKGKGIFTCWSNASSKDVEAKAHPSATKLITNGEQLAAEEGTQDIQKNDA